MVTNRDQKSGHQQLESHQFRLAVWTLGMDNEYVAVFMPSCTKQSG
jgi:hypothetical protein